MAAANDFCFNRGHENVGKRDCHFCTHCGTVCLKTNLGVVYFTQYMDHSLFQFLNSDIGIVILYIVKYIRKAFSLPKKINFEVQHLTNIHVFRFAFSDLYCYDTDLQNARNAVSDNLIFKISRGGMPPDPPSKERLRRSLVRIIN